jgi:hypothetical protein
LIDDIWRDFYRWLSDLGLGSRCDTFLDKVVILYDIDMFYMMCMLRRMVSCMGVGATLEEERWALREREFGPRVKHPHFQTSKLVIHILL